MTICNRVGALGVKVGMTSLQIRFLMVPVTLIKVFPNYVLELKKIEKSGYSSALLASYLSDEFTAEQIFSSKMIKSIPKPRRGNLSDVTYSEMRKKNQNLNENSYKDSLLIKKEFRIYQDENLPELGSQITSDHFVVGQKIDVCGNTIGKGFSGVVKRYGFGGGPASHGSSTFHKGPGSTGNRQDPGKVFKNKKMAGHMGDRRCTMKGLRVLEIDQELSLIAVKGSVPGTNGSCIMIFDSFSFR